MTTFRLKSESGTGYPLPTRHFCQQVVRSDQKQPKVCFWQKLAQSDEWGRLNHPRQAADDEKLPKVSFSQQAAQSGEWGRLNHPDMRPDDLRAPKVARRRSA